MADIRCPSCGKNNPDFLDACQFCQTPLKPESMLHIGENPVKKNTGELEPILPQWLKDVRQQGRDSAKEDAAEEAAKPKVQKNEAPDLLAGLASQARSDEDEIPDWLASINPATKPKRVETPAAEPEKDFFAQFNKSEPAPAAPVNEPVQEDVPTWMSGTTETPQAAEEKDELSEWFMKASAEPSAPVEIESNEFDAMDNADSPTFTFKESATPVEKKEDEDLGWLHSLEDSSKQSFDSSTALRQTQDNSSGQGFAQDTPATPQSDAGFLPAADSTQPSSQPEDLSWLNELGGVDIGISRQPEQVKPSAPQEDMSWLNQLGAVSEPTAQESASPQPAAQKDDLDWLNNLGGQAVTPFEEKPAQGELSWLKNLDEQQGIETPSDPVSPFVPRRTAPLDGESNQDSMPEWLKSATEEPSMPPPGALSEWFRETNQPSRFDDAQHGPSKPEPFDQTQGEPASTESNVFASASESASLSSQDVDSLFSVDMPDWLSRPEPGADDSPSQKTGIQTDDSLAPVDLPSWVQAMRPVESVIAETPDTENQPTEKEGPLAGLQGVIPIAPIGSSRRPKAISLKLQATDEQQSGAALFERILAGETNPRSLVSQATITTPRALRWLVTGLFIIVLGAMAYLRSEAMPVSAALPIEVRSASSVIARLPQNSFVLVVMDYEPALAAEMEAVSGPMLDQLVLTTRARLSFISTSPNGSALVRRLLTNTGISVPAPNGLDYKPVQNYNNLGYLPGGPAGVREFVESPTTAMPLADVTNFSEYAAVIVLTDHTESGRVWVEQLEARNQVDTYFAFQPLLFAASAQAGPMLQPYFSSNQITGMVSGLSDAVRYEFVNNSRPGTARIYWDSFGAGLLMAVILITIGSLWSLFMGIRARRAEAELG